MVADWTQAKGRACPGGDRLFLSCAKAARKLWIERSTRLKISTASGKDLSVLREERGPRRREGLGELHEDVKWKQGSLS